MKTIIIGGGIGGLGTAALLAKSGVDVTVFEKNEMMGGRASVFEAKGFRFDMGPSWYLMPEIFDQYFALLGEDIRNYIELIRLSPSYRVTYEGNPDQVDMYADLVRDKPTIEKLEPGAGAKLDSYLAASKTKYDIATNRFLYKNYTSVLDFVTPEVMFQGPRLSVFSTMDRYISKRFKSREVQQLLQYPLVFLGASPYNAPALYSLMSHIDFDQGVFYPQGGMYTLIEAMVKIGEKLGVTYKSNAEVTSIRIEDGKAVGVELADGSFYPADTIVSNADMHFTETKLLEAPYRSKTDSYWDKQVLAPSALLMYLGVKGKLPNLAHHNLRFSKDWKSNFDSIFGTPEFPSDPSFYVCAPSVTDPSVAPKGDENVFVLVPIAPKLDYSPEQLDNYAEKILEIIETEMGCVNLRKNLIFKRYFSVKDFEDRYHAFGGSALGPAHTLFQTAAFRPDTKSKKVNNLYYVGAGTNPGIGLPICLISAQLVYKRITNNGSSGPLKELRTIL